MDDLFLKKALPKPFVNKMKSHLQMMKCEHFTNQKSLGCRCLMYKPYILVVSDIMNLRISIARILGHAGYRVETATIITAAEQLNNKRFQLLFLDLQTPYQDGMKLLSFVRYRHTLMHTIVISSIDSFDFREKAIRNGANDYLLKPIDPGEIIQTCNSLLNPSFRQANL